MIISRWNDLGSCSVKFRVRALGGDGPRYSTGGMEWPGCLTAEKAFACHNFVMLVNLVQNYLFFFRNH